MRPLARENRSRRTHGNQEKGEEEKETLTAGETNLARPVKFAASSEKHLCGGFSLEDARNPKGQEL
jgi:hypothetical protein